MKPLNHLVIAIKGAGEMASGIAVRLYAANLQRIYMLDIQEPLAVRRGVSFSEAMYEGDKTVEGVTAVLADGDREIEKIWQRGKIAVTADPSWKTIGLLKPDIIIDAILAKKNLGTSINDAPLVIGLGPGFTAAGDVHLLIETNRGHNLGRIIRKGIAEPNTGVPGEIGGHTTDRVIRAPGKGRFVSRHEIGDDVKPGDLIGSIGEKEVRAGISGIIRGLIRSGTMVFPDLKLGDIDPRGEEHYCHTVSDKSRTISGAVLEGILCVYNDTHQ